MTLKSIRVGFCPRCHAHTFFAKLKKKNGKTVRVFFCTTCGYWFEEKYPPI